MLQPDDAVERARDMLRHALQLTPHLVTAYSDLAYIHMSYDVF